MLVDKPLGLNRPAVAGLPIRGLESLWDGFFGAVSTEDCEFPMMACGGWRLEEGAAWDRLLCVYCTVHAAAPTRGPGSTKDDARLHVFDGKP